jgi:Toxin co-regulated pilus biosynthesis protein Q
MLIHYKLSYFKKSALSMTCLVALMYPSVSKAGFEWTPPVRAIAAPEETVQANPQPVGPLTPELATETVQEQDSGLPLPVGNVEQAPIQEPMVTEAPVEKENSAPIAPPAPLTEGAVVEGFGKDIPLAIALRDIVPSHYAYVFSPRDIAGVKISWRGGKPWLEVLDNALAQQNLEAVINGNNLTIFNRQAEVLPVMEAPAQSPNANPLPLVEEEPIVAQPPAVKAQEEAIKIPVVDMKRHQKWSARPGATLRQTLESWAKSAGTELNWSTPYDYPVNNAFYFEGNFSEAVESLLSTYGGESPSPKGRLYPNLPDGPSVLMIN